MPSVTVAICTAGERATLKETISSLLAQELAFSIDCEILVVDNSRGDTALVARMAGDVAEGARFPVRWVRESRVGLGFARNMAIREARGEILAFVDDDVVVDPTWLSELVRVYEETGAAAVGGAIYPIWTCSRPQWVRGDLLQYLSLLDCGPARMACSFPNYPFGANISFQRELLQELGGFATGLGGGGTPTYLMDEVELCRRIERAGKTILYAPSVRVGHIIPPDRLTWRFFLGRAVSLGRSTARMGHHGKRKPSVLAVAKGLILATQRVAKHAAMVALLSATGRMPELVSESRHLAWNLAWMWETVLIGAESVLSLSSAAAPRAEG